MENLKKIQRLMNNARNIRRLFLEKIPMWKERPSDYDKTGWGFSSDESRFSACNPIKITFNSHCGTYGNSGSSTQLDMDTNIFREHLLGYLNRNKEAIMLEIADTIQQEAISLRVMAEKELKDRLDMLNKLDIE